MDLQEVWKKLETEKLNKPVLGAVTIAKKSKHPVQRLKNAYLITTAFSVVCLAFFLYLFIVSPERLVKGSLLLVILAYVFFFVINYSMYKKINIALPVNKSLKEALTHTHDFITSNIKFQERVSLFIYPIAAASGFFLGGAEASSDLETLMRKNVVIISFFLTLAIITPLSYYLTKWMYKISYGRCLLDLQGLIHELENPE
ncbi:MAG: hypothetical protein JSS79_06550 [Bacteroidetes bacterium]|nr:hypothetical protein [Bacteroidota bacterium]